MSDTREIEIADVNEAARALEMWRLAPRELEALAAEHEAKPAFASRVTARAAREVAIARRAMGVAECGGRLA